jgi:hypothetical protein
MIRATRDSRIDRALVMLHEAFRRGWFDLRLVDMRHMQMIESA